MVGLTIDHFKDLLRGRSFLIETDNTSVVSHINKFGGVRSWDLWQEALALFNLTVSLNMTLSAVHRPVKDKVLADKLSRTEVDA